MIFLNHLAAELDRWDPRVVDGIAARRRVIAFDNRGLARRKAGLPSRWRRWRGTQWPFIRALGAGQVDLLGFSLGGFISQVIAQETAATRPEDDPRGHRSGRGHGHRQGDVDDPSAT